MRYVKFEGMCADANVATVKWKVGETEIGLRVPHRLNVFHDWHLASIAVEVQKRRLIQAVVELSD